MSIESFAIVVPWLEEQQLSAFLDAWRIGSKLPRWLVLQRDEEKRGCADTKNRGIDRALVRGADIVVILDDDCYPAEIPVLEDFARAHVAALQPQDVVLSEPTTSPPSRGTPYTERAVKMPVACSMGFWRGVPDYCAPRQLTHEATELTFHRRTFFGRYFPLCGMNIAFRPATWDPWSRFINVPRFDDIWMGWLWQKEAYRRGFCFSTRGPDIHHARQSNVWRNLAAEARHLERSETLWRDIALSTETSYSALRALLPTDPGGSDR